MATINVTTPGGQYPIIIEPGLISNLPLSEIVRKNRRIVVTNTKVGPFYADHLTGEPIKAAIATMSDGEAYKNMETVVKLYGDLVRAGVDRSGTVFALGGGVVGDTAGFVAATFMRGMRLIQIPTSLLAMVDSSVGGKVGVDLPEGKNLVGAFKQPEQVLIDPEVLRTLPDVEWKNGMAEVIKYGFLADDALLDPSLHSIDHAEEIITRSVKVKVDIVQRDPFEAGERAHLNLGHTFAHPIEHVSKYAIPHGQAVGIGMLAAARLSYDLGVCSPEIVDTVSDLLQSVGLPQSTGGLDADAMWEVMKTDKKWRNGRSRFVLLRGIGQPFIMEDIDKARVMSVLASIQ